MRTPTFPETLRLAIDSKLTDVNTAIPARVERYYPADNSIDATPLIKEGYRDEWGNRQTDSLPVICHVPVVFPGSGGVRIRFPISKGDTVLLVFSQASLDRWLTIGGEVDPEDDRRFAYSDGIAIPGLQDFGSAGDNDPMIEFTSTHVHLGSSVGSEPVHKASTYDPAFDTLVAAIGTAVGGIPGGGAASGAITTALTTFQQARALALSTKAKVS